MYLYEYLGFIHLWIIKCLWVWKSGCLLLEKNVSSKECKEQGFFLTIILDKIQDKSVIGRIRTGLLKKGIELYVVNKLFLIKKQVVDLKLPN